MASVIKRFGTLIGEPKAAIINVIEWNGTAPAPADFHGVAALVTAKPALYIQVQDAHGVPVPNAVVQITFAKGTAVTTEDALSVVTGYGTPVSSAAVANFFPGVVGVSSGDSVAIGAQTAITHLVTSNAYGEVALKFNTTPSTVDATAISIRSGTAQVTVTDLSGLKT